MAAKKTNWGAILALVAIAFVLWILLTRKTLASTGGSGGGIVGGGGGGFPLAQQQQPQGGRGLSLGGGPGAGGAGAASSASSFLSGWLSSVLGTGYQNAASLQLIDTGYIPGQGADDGLEIPSVPLSLFQEPIVDIPGYSDSIDSSGIDTTDTSLDNSYISPTDDSGTIDLSSYGIDPNYGSDQVNVEDPYNYYGGDTTFGQDTLS